MWKTASAYPWPGPALNFNHSLRIWWLAEKRVFVIKFDKTSPLGKLVHKHLQRVMQAWCTAFSTTNPASTGRTTQDLKRLRLCITMISPSEQIFLLNKVCKGKRGQAPPSPKSWLKLLFSRQRLNPRILPAVENTLFAQRPSPPNDSSVSFPIFMMPSDRVSKETPILGELEGTEEKDRT